jgi:co-chaperonin GroES (HSP10)
MALNSKYILVTKMPEETKEGFQAVQIEDSSTYMGIVKELPENPIWIGNTLLEVGNTIIFAKYSPNTHLITKDNVEYKYITTEDILEITK